MMSGLAQSFAHFKAAGKNPRWSWSARSADGETVVMTLWKDIIDYSTSPISYNTFGRKDLPEWIKRPGNHESIENLKWAIDNCDKRFRVVIIVAKDTNAQPREIAESYPHDRLVMEILDFNEATGEFYAVNVGK